MMKQPQCDLVCKRRITPLMKSVYVYTYKCENCYMYIYIYLYIYLYIYIFILYFPYYSIECVYRPYLPLENYKRNVTICYSPIRYNNITLFCVAKTSRASPNREQAWQAWELHSLTNIFYPQSCAFLIRIHVDPPLHQTFNFPVKRAEISWKKVAPKGLLIASRVNASALEDEGKYVADLGTWNE